MHYQRGLSFPVFLNPLSSLFGTPPSYIVCIVFSLSSSHREPDVLSIGEPPVVLWTNALSFPPWHLPQFETGVYDLQILHQSPFSPLDLQTIHGLRFSGSAKETGAVTDL